MFLGKSELLRTSNGKNQGHLGSGQFENDEASNDENRRIVCITPVTFRA